MRRWRVRLPRPIWDEMRERTSELPLCCGRGELVHSSLPRDLNVDDVMLEGGEEDWARRGRNGHFSAGACGRLRHCFQINDFLLPNPRTVSFLQTIDGMPLTPAGFSPSSNRDSPYS